MAHEYFSIDVYFTSLHFSLFPMVFRESFRDTWWGFISNWKAPWPRILKKTELNLDHFESCKTLHQFSNTRFADTFLCFFWSKDLESSTGQQQDAKTSTSCFKKMFFLPFLAQTRSICPVVTQPRKLSQVLLWKKILWKNRPIFSFIPKDSFLFESETWETFFVGNSFDRELVLRFAAVWWPRGFSGDGDWQNCCVFKDFRELPTRITGRVTARVWDGGWTMLYLFPYLAYFTLFIFVRS